MCTTLGLQTCLSFRSIVSREKQARCGPAGWFIATSQIGYKVHLRNVSTFFQEETFAASLNTPPLPHSSLLPARRTPSGRWPFGLAWSGECLRPPGVNRKKKKHSGVVKTGEEKKVKNEALFLSVGATQTRSLLLSKQSTHRQRAG